MITLAPSFAGEKMDGSFDAALVGLEEAVAERPLRYERLRRAFHEVVVPSDVSASQLERLYDACYRLLGLGESGEAGLLGSDLYEWEAGHIAACARSAIERTFFDPDAPTRQWVARMQEDFRNRGEPIPDGLGEGNLPPELAIPFDEETARRHATPFLGIFEAALARDPTIHFKLCWEVANSGYPVFREIFRNWLEELERKGIGVRGTPAAIRAASDLLRRTEQGEFLSYAECRSQVMPLVENPHPMIAAGAARYLGAHYAAGAFAGEAEAPSLERTLLWLRDDPRLAATLCGAFVNGYDQDLGGLSALEGSEELVSAGFDLDDWTLTALSRQEERYLPNAQALWFYVHERYCADPAYVTRLIEAGLAWVALMCATELPGPVEGMQAVLERLSAINDPQVSLPARRHLEAYYEAAPPLSDRQES